MHGRLITKIAGQRIFGVRVDEVTAAGCEFYSSSSALLEHMLRENPLSLFYVSVCYQI